MNKQFTAGMVILLAFGTLTGCSRNAEPEPQAVQAQPEPVQWGPCEEPEPSADDDEAAEAAREILSTAKCGHLSVPIDHEVLDGPTANIALIQLPATGEKIGSLVVNPGGPGAAGVQFIRDLAADIPAPLRERFDVVGFDPRGIGESTPAIECNTDAEDDADRADPDTDYSAAGVAETETEIKQFVQRCVDRTGTDFLAHVGTDSVVRDMDLLRAALGDDKLTYLGFSYGTRLGSEYAEAFGDRVRAMVLDGAVDPAVGAMQWPIDQAASFQKTFDAYATDCAASPDCPVGTDPAKAVERLNALIEPLATKPAPTDDPRGLSYRDARVAVDWGLYPPSYWEDLTAGLIALRDGKPADDLLTMADEYNERDADGRYTNYNDAYVAIDCVDYPYATDPAAWIDLDKRNREVSPYDDFGSFNGNAPREACAFWPVPSEYQPHPASAPDLPKTLVISTTGDPSTPYLDGVNLAKQLDATLLTVEGIQHTAGWYGNACVDDIINEYLIDLKLPESDSRCESEFIP